MASEFFGRRCECRFYKAACVNKMMVSVTGTAVKYVRGSSSVMPVNMDKVYDGNNSNSVFLSAIMLILNTPCQS